ncbi:hypothetical protein, partial [Lacticaseibacillus zhaodongensis]|uniref:hypothetical protein n=1 Tax=Lacticaseibacillus zhaodongensis TaxID=2668065 RepID=UPI001E4FC057
FNSSFSKMLKNLHLYETLFSFQRTTSLTYDNFHILSKAFATVKGNFQPLEALVLLPDNKEYLTSLT